MVEIHNTTVKVKKEFFKTFSDMIGNQFMHGGDKYKLPGFDDREATDVISSVFGGPDQIDWLLGTVMKYIFRFKNFKREKDLLKIATYCYILWLKCGFHLQEEHDEDVDKQSKVATKTTTGTACSSPSGTAAVSGLLDGSCPSCGIILRSPTMVVDGKIT